MTQDDPTTQDGRPHRPADDSEEVYFQGSPMLRFELAKKWPLALFGIVIALAPIFVKLVLARDTHIVWWIYIIAILIGLLILMTPWLKTKTVRYRITNYRIDFERGLLSRTIDTMELWHVDDLKLHQSFLQRMLGVGQIAIVSADEEEPRIYLDGIPNPTDLFRILQQRIISVKRQRGVIKMDMPISPPPASH